MRSSAIVKQIDELAPRIVQLTIAVNDAAFHFSAGQWVNFRFPHGVSRAYTIASAPGQTHEIQLCVRAGSGKGGTALQELAPGAEVTIDGPHGDFVLPEGDEKPVVFLAGDTGIAPVRSIVLHMLTTNDPRAATVLYEPDKRHILYAADFDPLARSGAIIHESGRIEGLVSRNRNRCLEATVMAAGFDDFLARAERALGDIGVDPTRIISESFGPEP